MPMSYFVPESVVPGFAEYFDVAGPGLSQSAIDALQPAVYGEGLGSLMYDTEPGWASNSQVADKVVSRDYSKDDSNWWSSLSDKEKMMYGVGLPFLLSNILGDQRRYRPPGQDKYSGPLSKYSFDPSRYSPYRYQAAAGGGLMALKKSNPMQAIDEYHAQAQTSAYPDVLAKAKAGDYNAMLALNRLHNTPNRNYAGGGPVEQMSNANAVGANTGFPMADIQRGAYATPYQQPISQNVVTGAGDTRVDPYTGEEKLAGGGISSLGGYSDGGRLLRGPGDGVSDSIPAMIGQKQPARLADGEFVVPARIVSELGNGSTDAGARQLYAMMDRVQKARGKTTGKGKMAKDTKAGKYLPA